MPTFEEIRAAFLRKKKYSQPGVALRDVYESGVFGPIDDNTLLAEAFVASPWTAGLKGLKWEDLGSTSSGVHRYIAETIIGVYEVRIDGKATYYKLANVGGLVVCRSLDYGKKHCARHFETCMRSEFKRFQ